MEIVWIFTDRQFAYLVRMGTYYSIINRSGIPGEEEMIETDDFELWTDRAIEYEDEDI